jgi:hypothetical protein
LLSEQQWIRINNKEKFYQLVRDILWKWETYKEEKMCQFKIYCVLISMYGAETWTWPKASITRLKAAKMRFLRSIEEESKR